MKPAALEPLSSLCHRAFDIRLMWRGLHGKFCGLMAASAASSWASPTTVRSPGASQGHPCAGGEIALTYQGEALKKRVEPLAAEIGAIVAGDCDVSDEASIDAAFAEIEKIWGKIDFLVHAIGFSDKDELTGRYVDTSPTISTRPCVSRSIPSPLSPVAPKS